MQWFRVIIAWLRGLSIDERALRDQISALRGDIEQLRRIEMADQVTQAEALAAINAEVAANTSVSASAVTLLQNLTKRLNDAIDAQDWSAVIATRDALAANDKALADAVVANTPADGGSTAQQ